MINSIKVKNFRTYNDYSLSFSDGLNIIVGNNGIGKTSLIEAIHIALNGKSWRSNFDSILKQDEKWWRIDLIDNEKNIIVKYDGKKSFEINEKKYLTLPKKNYQPLVLFEPDDLNLIYGSPSRRRRWLDKLLKDINNEYKITFNKFEKVLKQRNSALKNKIINDDFFVWDLQFADLSSQVIKSRKKIIDDINQKISDEYKSIAGSDEIIKLEYSYDGLDSKQKIINQLQKNRQIETLTNTTSIGPQKHDILFFFKNQLAATSASRGENRSIISSLKNIEYNIKKTDECKPLILLDDIMSELDENHQIGLLNNFKESQVIITSVDVPKIKNNEVNIIKLS